MSTTLSSFTRSDPVLIPGTNNNNEQSYKDMIKQLAAQAPEPYGAIPPLKRKQKRKRPKEPVIRRLSHVENWLAVDSKESLPDEEDLKPSSPFRNFLSTDFLVLPLHMPPPSLSAQGQPEEILIFPDTKKKLDLDEDEDEEDEDEEDEDDEEEDEDDESGYEENRPKTLTKQRSIPSFSRSVIPSTSTTKYFAMSSSPPQQDEPSNWIETLRRSLVLSTSPQTKKTLIPMPLPPPRPRLRKRRSEATTQPRFNPETNTYTRDTRSNPDHLRMISAELNMMRARKLSSPLKPRGFLPRRTDVFIRGEHRRRSLLLNEIAFV
ncbi:hypothetical protein G6F57_000977 [Rhizopus arrhizus]|uniref:Uncharacterized protein n=1 Tax=Rhizopus oryzae TaxID=64495 RepID=A0A9P7BNP6_RHIOR|nr:hypothetical protein G6F23_010499 [Rhizopus arrhizus]KAG1398622.1 hypothetical protein G6F58_011283 [Rhizopus delemar]KAG0758494.1 hypothetical protein G6F24_009760 [Rhizopus arrhizus]KAG0781313.1 hypothetical protein G6F22_009637 [Rhizopus arrhizus]KAG0790062.1 hypothetical protein G6F21_006079 [Rhizopus arrhizus]